MKLLYIICVLSLFAFAIFINCQPSPMPEGTSCGIPKCPAFTEVMLVYLPNDEYKVYDVSTANKRQATFKYLQNQCDKHNKCYWIEILNVEKLP